MLRAAILGSITCVLTYVSGCSTQPLARIAEYLPSTEPTISNELALTRALQLNSLTEAERPFHLLLEIAPPSNSPAEVTANMRAQVEIYWLNRRTYRTVITSRQFNQTRIVNGSVVEEHNTPGTKPSISYSQRSRGQSTAFYPRWLQNFTDAILNPVPNAAELAKIPGSIPATPQSHPCFTSQSDQAEKKPEPTPETFPDPTATTQVCFEGPEPKLASIQDFTTYITYDDFTPFGTQQIPRTLINSLPANIQLRGRILALAPLAQSDYRLLKATQYTPPAEKILTTLVPQSTAESLLEFNPRQPWPPAKTSTAAQANIPMHLYIRTDRTGQVREAYRDPNDHYGLQNQALRAALNLKFKPLIIDGIPHQMEAPLTLP